MKYYLFLLMTVVLVSCAHPKVEVHRAGDASTSCYEVEDELVQINELVKQTDSREDVIARQKELLIMLEKKNCL